MSTNCSDVLGEIPLYVGGDLESPAREQLEKHLEHCPACRDALGRASEARAVLRDHLGNPGIDASRPILWPGIRSRMLEEGLLAPEATAVPSSDQEPTRFGRLHRILPLAAAAAALFALGTWTGRLGTAPSGDGVITPGSGRSLVENVGPLQPIGSDPLPSSTHRSLTPVNSGGRSLADGAESWEAINVEALPRYRPTPYSGNRAAGAYSTKRTRRDGVR
jgi:hypothetical protein